MAIYGCSFSFTEAATTELVLFYGTLKKLSLILGCRPECGVTKVAKMSTSHGLC